MKKKEKTAFFCEHENCNRPKDKAFDRIRNYKDHMKMHEKLDKATGPNETAKTTRFGLTERRVKGKNQHVVFGNCSICTENDIQREP